MYQSLVNVFSCMNKMLICQNVPNHDCNNLMLKKNISVTSNVNKYYLFFRSNISTTKAIAKTKIIMSSVHRSVVHTSNFIHIMPSLHRPKVHISKFYIHITLQFTGPQSTLLIRTYILCLQYTALRSTLLRT